jgi:UDP-2,4-diacetamido-2,4,6-trideoxy-beta-L-altropyranose hydrolase
LGERLHASCIVVDHYQAQPGYLSRLKGAGVLAVIDDIADRDFVSADWVLNQNLAAHGLQYRTRPECEKLFGPEFALLRPEFAAARQKLSRKFSADDRRLLVTLGGGDNSQAALVILEALEDVKPVLQVRCVVNRCTSQSALESLTVRSRHKIEFPPEADEMWNHMSWADLSINAGGTTCWELCCLGVPMLVIATAQNQESNVRALERHGYAKNLGKENTGTRLAATADQVQQLLGNPERRSAMARRAQSLVDGLGAKRAAKSLYSLVERRCRKR